MRDPDFVFAVTLGVALLSGCERRRESPAVGDASTTGATAVPRAPRGERELEPSADAGAEETVDGGVATRPAPERKPADERRRARERALERAPLTIVQAGDRDRNLGIAPAAPARIEIDGGACTVGIEIKHAP